MIRNYIIIAFRSIRKRPLLSSINAFGLIIAISAGLLIFLLASHELSYDNFHARGKEIYRVYFEAREAEEIKKASSTPTPLQVALQEEYQDEFTEVVRWKSTNGSLEYNGQLFDELLRFTDEGFFELFTFPILSTASPRPLGDLGSIVLSERNAQKIFGQTDPIGQTVQLLYDGVKKDFIVSAILSNPPTNSSLEFSSLIRYENDADYANNKDEWQDFSHTTFVGLAKGYKVPSVEASLRSLCKKYFHETILNITRDGGIPDANGDVYSMHLQPLSDIHFDSYLAPEGQINMARIYPLVLLLIGFFILIIASINFVNLTLGSSVTRSLEVGVRKVLGADRTQLLMQFWWEAFILILIALVLGTAIAQWMIPYFNNLFNSELTLAHPSVFLILTGILMVVALIGAGYPALILSRFQPAIVLKRLTKMQKPGKLRNTLVVLQFTLSILLISATLVIYQQINFMSEKALGFNTTQVISLPVGHDIEGAKALALMRNRLQSRPEILSITGSTNNLGMGNDNSRSRSTYGFDHKERTVYSDVMGIDYDYLKTLDIKLIEGRTFDPNRLTDTSSAILINETLAKDLGADFKLGDAIDITEPPSQVIGILSDYHVDRLSSKIRPLTLMFSPDMPPSYILVKTAPKKGKEAMKILQQLWQEIAPRSEYEASFLNENIDRLYRREKRLSQLLLLASGLAILLSCMGLFAMALLTIVQRTKEIGIRKVLGASIASLVKMLSQDFLQLVLLAALLALPISWYLMNQWLENFYYHIPFPWLVFFWTTLLTVGIAFLTISFHSIRAALVNPIESLKDE